MERLQRGLEAAKNEFSGNGKHADAIVAQVMGRALTIQDMVVFRVQFRMGLDGVKPTASVMAIKNLSVTAATRPLDWDAGHRNFGVLR